MLESIHRAGSKTEIELLNHIDVVHEKISEIDWQLVSKEMNAKGYSLVPQFLNCRYCKELIDEYGNDDIYRKTVTMERHSFGLGEYKYFKYPLPGLI
jgi:uncharacterized protein